MAGALWLFSLEIAYAGAWNLAPGDGQIISTFDYSEASSTFSDIDAQEDMLSFTKNEGRVFFEHGLTQDWTFVANGAHQTLQLSGSQSDINFSDFDDIELGLRYQIARKEGLAVGVQGSYIIGGGPPSSILDVNGPDDSVELRGLVGQSKAFEKFVLFYDAQFAVRTDNFDNIDEWHSDLTLGFKKSRTIKKKEEPTKTIEYMFLGQVFHASRDSFGRDGFIVPTQRRTKLKASFVYEYKPNRLVQIGVQETIAGRNIVRERGISLGTWIRY